MKKGLNNTQYSSYIAKISVGDHQAFAKLYDCFYADLLKFAYSKVNNLTIAEDIVHDLFLSIWRTKERLVNIDYLPGYLYSACRYLIIRQLKRTKENKTIDENHFMQIESNESLLEDRLYYRYLLDMVTAEIENLPEKCKVIFKLSRNSMKSNREIAEILDISESTVENQINKAIKRLRTFGTLQLALFVLQSPCTKTAPHAIKDYNTLHYTLIEEIFNFPISNKLF